MIRTDKPKVTEDVEDAAEMVATPHPFHDGELQRDAEQAPGGAENKVSAEAGSVESLDVFNEDVLQDDTARAIGYMGKTSEVQWLKRVQENVEHPDGHIIQTRRRLYGPPGNDAEAAQQRQKVRKNRRQRSLGQKVSINTLTYHSDHLNMHVDPSVDPYELPFRYTARRLLDAYLATVQGSLSFLAEASFYNEVERYYDCALAGTHIPLSTRWLAMLNFVFAVGAKYLQIVEAEWHFHDQDHHIYYSRGQSLNKIHGNFPIVNPDLLEIQMTAVQALYLLSVGHVSR